jgi:PEP-CTERM motif
MRRSATLLPILALILALAITPTARAQPFGFETDTGPALLRINLATGQQTVVGALSSQILGLAGSANGQLFGLDQNGGLHMIDPNTAAVGPTIGFTGKPLAFGLHFNGNTLLGVNGTTTSNIYSINTSNAMTTPITTTNLATNKPFSITNINSATALLLNGNDQLFSVDLATGATTLLSSINGNTQTVQAIDFGPDGKLYGVDFLGQEGIINPATGLFTPVGSPSMHEISTLTVLSQAAPVVTPVPEPTSLSILAAGLGIVGWWRKRRARAGQE